MRKVKFAATLNPNDVNVHYRLARLYRASGKKVEAKAEFDKTRNLQKASDETLFKKLHEAQAKGKPEQETPDATFGK